MTPTRAAAAFLALLTLAAPAAAQTTPATPGGGATTRGEGPPPAPPIEAGRGVVALSAALAGTQSPLRAGLHWRIYRERAEDDGSRPLVAESREAAPTFTLADDAYVAHVAYGLASATRRIVVGSRPVTERLSLSAGALSIQAMLGEQPLPKNRVTISVFVPDKGNPEAKLVVSGAAPGDVLRLPEGQYHIVSTYLEQIPPSLQTTAPKPGEPSAPGGARAATNSVVTADLRVPSGKLIEARVAHRAATLTLKLVNAPGGEALPNTIFTVLTPGGDVVRELIGAFPSLVLAEGEYVAIARHAERTYQTTFRVTSALDRDVEVVAQ